MATLTQARQGLATCLATIAGLNTHAKAPDNIAEPAALVIPDPGTFLTFDSSVSRGSDDLRLVVVLLVSRADDLSGQDNIDEYVAPSGTKSIKAAVEADPELGGVVDYAVVTEARSYGTINYAAVDYFGCEFVVEVGLS